jgi:hypothetical protein
MDVNQIGEEIMTLDIGLDQGEKDTDNLPKFDEEEKKEEIAPIAHVKKVAESEAYDSSEVSQAIKDTEAATEEGEKKDGEEEEPLIKTD